VDEAANIVTTDSHGYIIESVGINPNPILTDF
jgi:hypothetical protein